MTSEPEPIAVVEVKSEIRRLPQAHGAARLVRGRFWFAHGRPETRASG
jgi:hypothetical protein